MTTKTEVQCFADHESMWDGFAGAESWANGDEPVFIEIGKWLIIADSQSVNISGDEEKDEFGGMYIPIVFPSQKSAIAFLSGLPDNFDPSDYGAIDY